MKYLAEQWFNECNSTDDVIDVFITEFVLKAMPQALAGWVRDQKPDSLTEATVWADEHAYNREYGRDRRREANQVEKWKFRRGDREASTSWEAKPRDDKSDRPGRSNHQWRDNRHKDGLRTKEDRGRKNEHPRGAGTRQDETAWYGMSVVCYRCREKGHVAKYCPGRFNRTNLTGVGMERDLIVGKWDGKSCKGMRLDTGADRTIVRRDKIHSRSMTAKTASFKPSKVPVYSLPLVWVEVELPGFSKRMLVAVQEDLDFDALLG